MNRFVGMMALTCGLLLPVAAHATTYYVANETQGGNDNNNGTSPSTPIATLHLVNSLVYSPGDTILLQRGSVWQGILVPCAAVQCSGTAAAPIKIDAYGDASAPLPRIDGAGSARATVSLVNQSYWEIRDLEVTNHGPVGFNYGGIEAICDSNVAAMRVCHHIYIGHNYVHDINGNGASFNAYANNAIWVTWNIHSAYNNGRNWVSTSNYWDDVVIEWNVVSNVSYHGIFASDDNPILTSISDPICPTMNFNCMSVRPNTTGLQIRSNVLNYIAGDGIQFGNTTGAVVEFNVVGNWGRGVPGVSPPAASGLWSYAAKNTTIQHNEVYGGVNSDDGMAFDIDFANKSDYIQFNYSHNNRGGMVMVEDTYNSSDPTGTLNYIDDPIVRFNVSINDGANTGVVTATFAHWSTGPNLFNFANNSIYQSATNYSTLGPNVTPMFGFNATANDPACQNTTISGAALIYNNIFYSDGATVYPKFDLATLTDNVFYSPGGASCAPVPGGQVSNVDGGASTQNPMLVSFPAPPAVPGDFRLKAGSPALGSGMYTADLGPLDYYSNAVQPNVAPNRGAYDGPGL